MKKILILENISKKFNDKYVISKLNLSIKKNSIYGLVGENGAGKTTIMNIVCGILKPNTGNITLFNKQNKDLYKARKNIGIMIETPGLYLENNAYENLEYYSTLFGIEYNKKFLDEQLELVGLHDVKKKLIEQYSLGMKQRLGVAIALLNNPNLLILDEPANGLDPIGIIDIRNILKRLVSERDLSIMISSHILNELEKLADDFGFVSKGKMIREISYSDITTNSMKLLNLKVNNNQFLFNLLKKINISNYHKYDSRTNTHQIQISLKNLNFFLKKLLDNNIMIEDINYTQPTLEDYYMDLMGAK